MDRDERAALWQFQRDRRVGAIDFAQAGLMIEFFITVPARRWDPPGFGVLIGAKFCQLISNIAFARVWHFIAETEPIIEDPDAQRESWAPIREANLSEQLIMVIAHELTFAPRLFPRLILVRLGDRPDDEVAV